MGLALRARGAGFVPARDSHPGVCWSGCAALLPIPPVFSAAGGLPVAALIGEQTAYSASSTYAYSPSLSFSQAS